MIFQLRRVRDTSRGIGLFTTAVLVASLINPAAAHADNRIGSTAIAQNKVEQVATKVTPIGIGDDVFMNEQVKTGVESAAKFVFSDQTNLALGPTSTVKLDRFVYRGDVNYAKAAINFTAGAFRFTTGGSDKGAYELKTSTATIGVRGTVFELAVARGVTNLTLIEGEIAVCPRARFDGDPRRLSKAQLRQFQCQDLTQPNQTARISSRSAVLSSAPVNFAANFCSGGGGLCSVTTTATASVAPVNTGALDPSNPALCYANPDPD